MIMVMYCIPLNIVVSAAPGGEYRLSPRLPADSKPEQLRVLQLLRLQPPRRHLLVAGRDETWSPGLTGTSVFDRK